MSPAACPATAGLEAATIPAQGVPGVIDKLQEGIERTDGCPIHGSPDGNGPGRDWITDCTVQQLVYDLLAAALSF